jgi:hypothetical protein
MYDVREEIKKDFNLACIQLKQEKECALKSTYLISKLYYCNAQINLNIPEKLYFKKLGLRKDQYYNRAKAGSLLMRFADFRKPFEDGEISMSVLAVAMPKITEANSSIILNNVKGKTKREAARFLSKVDSRGNVSEKDVSVEITITLKESQLCKLGAARQVLSSRGKIPNNSEILLTAIEDLLDKRDPVRKAKRAQSRDKKKAFISRDNNCREDGSASKMKKSRDKKIMKDNLKSPSHRLAVPSSITHSLWLRDGRRCSHIYPDGSRCDECFMLEKDHKVLWARGGEHSKENMRILCKHHNMFYAEQALGREFMRRKLHEAKVISHP